MNTNQKNNKKNAYIIGGGIAALSTAAFLIRDGNIAGENIYIFEELSNLGGSCDGSGNPNDGYVIRGGRMLNFPTYECTWNLLKTIPSLNNTKKSVLDEIIEFNNTFTSYSKARVIDKERNKVDLSTMGLSSKARFDLLKLISRPESSLELIKISEWFEEEFFESNFWYIWATTFAFQPWHSVLEMRRYMNRFIHEFPRLSTLEGISRTPYNQYDSLILPIARWLKSQKVNFDINSKVVDIHLETLNNNFSVKGIEFIKDNNHHKLSINEKDLVFLTNGCMTECSSLGSMNSSPNINSKYSGGAWSLWEKVCNKGVSLGNPIVFDNHKEKTLWESFTVTLKDSKFFTLMEDFTENTPGTGGLVTFKDSNWLMSIVLPYQPHFLNQPNDVQVFWGYGLFPNKKGNYVQKEMMNCSGEEIMIELCNHLKFNKELPLIIENANCIPCIMPYITSQFMPRSTEDRPPVIPEGSINLAFIGQFCEIPKDVVFTVEYSIRSAQTAVYSLLNITKKIPPINDYRKNPTVLFNALKTLFK